MIKPPSNKKTIGLAYVVETSFKGTSERAGTNINGKRAVIERGIAWESHQKDMRNKRLATNHEFSDKLPRGGIKFNRKKTEIPKKIIKFFTDINKIFTGIK